MAISLRVGGVYRRRDDLGPRSKYADVDRWVQILEMKRGAGGAGVGILDEERHVVRMAFMHRTTFYRAYENFDVAENGYSKHTYLS